MVDGQPYVIPTLYGRDGDVVYVHGSAASRMLRQLAGGVPACLTVTHVDGVVLARSAFHHSINYRSAVVLGTVAFVENPEEKLRALEVVTEQVVPGRRAEVRGPNPREDRATAVLRLPLYECSAKIRNAGVRDEVEDLELDVWAGVVPLRTVPCHPVADPDLRDGTPLPATARLRRRPRRAGGPPMTALLRSTPTGTVPESGRFMCGRKSAPWRRRLVFRRMFCGTSTSLLPLRMGRLRSSGWPP